MASGLELLLANRRPSDVTPRRVPLAPATTRPAFSLRPRTLSPATIQAIQQEQKPKPRSFLQQVSDQVFNIPKGAITFGAKIGQQLLVAPRLIEDVGKGDLPIGDVPGILGSFVAPWQHEEWTKPGQAEKYSPISQMMGTSFGQTALRLRHPSRYADAIAEGRILDVMLEDLGNASLIAAGGAGGLESAAGHAAEAGLGRTAATIGRVGDVAQQVSHLTAEGANGPVTLLKMPFKGAELAGKALWERLPEGEGALRTATHNKMMEARAGLAEHFPLYFDDKGIIGRRISREQRARAGRASDRVYMDFEKAGRKLGIEPDDPRVVAAMALENGVAQIDYEALQRGEHLTAEQIRQMHVLRDLPEHSYTSEGQQVAHSYLNGKISAEDRAIVDAVRDESRRQLANVTERALDAEGRPITGPLDPQYLSDDPIDSLMELEINRAVKDGVIEQGEADTLFEMRGQGAGWHELADVSDLVGALLDSPDVYPTAWRPMMTAVRAMGAADQALGLRMPRVPSAMLAAGLERPRYLPGGIAEEVLPRYAKRAAKEAINEGMAPGLRMHRSENRRVSNEIQPYSLRTLAHHVAREVRDVEFNKGVAQFAEHAATDRINTVIPQEHLDALWERATTRAEAERGTPHMIERRTRQMYGESVMDALKEQGYEPFVGNLDSPNPGDWNVAATAKHEEIYDDMVVLPSNVKRALEVHWTNSKLSYVLNALRVTNSWWKRNVLPFSVRWQVGDMIGGMFMAWSGGGVSAPRLLSAFGDLDAAEAGTRRTILGRNRQVREARPGLRAQFERNVLDNPDFVDTGINRQTMRREMVARVPRSNIGRGLESVRQRSYRFNDKINRFARHRFVLAKLYEKLQAEHISLDTLDGSDAAWARPDVQRAVNAAVEDANKVMGTFDEMNPTEQRIIKNVTPFYSWQRHITALAYHTALDNPARMVWTLRMGSYADQEDLPDFLKGSLNVPDRFVPDWIVKGDALLPTNWLNPYNDVISGGLATDPFKSFAPGLKLTAAALTGADLNSGFMQLTRPGGTARLDSRGRETFTPLISRPNELLYQLLKQIPLTREALNLAPTGSLAGIGLGPHPRYETGRLYTTAAGEPIATSGGSATGARLLALSHIPGIPGISPINKEEALKIQSGSTTHRASPFGNRTLTSGKLKRITLKHP